MNKLKNFLNSIKNKSIHIIGVTGAEGSSILNLLKSEGLISLTLHDFIQKDAIEKNFKIWHKGLSAIDRNAQYSKFLKNISGLEFHDKNSYLKNIDKADIVFVPQSWRLYSRNKKLFDVKNSGVPFYSLMRLYLDFAPAKVLGVTGSVGKGSVANLIYGILKRNGKTVYFSGNESWRLQLADQMLHMKSTDYLILEISHRQMIDGFTRSPDMVVVTNLYPNHLDEMSFKDYCRFKLSLIKKQNSDQIAVINYDSEILRIAAQDLKSKVVFYSHKNPKVNMQAVLNIFSNLNEIKSNHYIENILAATTAVLSLRLKADNLPALITEIPPLKARLEKIGEVKGIAIFDDIKSTTPWAAIRAIDELSPGVVLILGGDTKNILYDDLANKIVSGKITAFVLKSPLSEELKNNHSKTRIIIKNDLESAIKDALFVSKQNGKILISPAAANFYSKFIKSKKSIRKIINSIT